MTCNGRPIVAHSHKQIDAYADSVGEKVAARAHTDLDAVLERYRAIFGNAENEAGEVGDVALEAFDNLISNAPTSVRGVRALLSYLLEVVADLGQQFFEEDKLRAHLNSIDEALEDIHPNITVTA